MQSMIKVVQTIFPHYLHIAYFTGTLHSTFSVESMIILAGNYDDKARLMSYLTTFHQEDDVANVGNGPHVPQTLQMTSILSPCTPPAR